MRHSPPLDTTRSPFRVWLLGAGVLVLLRLVGEVVPLLDQTGWLWVTRIGEGWLVAGLMVLGLAPFPLRTAAHSVGKVRTVAVAAVLLPMTLGQLVDTTFHTYPFVDWNMYTGRTSEVTYVRVDLVYGEEREHLPLRDEVRVAKEPRAVTGRLHELASAAAEGDPEASQLLEETLTALAEYRGEPMPERVDVLNCVVVDPSSEQTSDCELVEAVQLEGSG